MTAPVIADAPATASYGAFKPFHIFCRCTLDVALCGTKRTRPRRLTSVRPKFVCAVCDDLDALPCPRCGGKPA